MDRRDLVATLLEDRGDLIVVGGLGSAVYDMSAAGDNDRNFYLWGAMGSAAMIGLGLALAQPETPVLVLTGDGEMLMGLGAFASIAQHAPKNLSVCILDNEQYAETGLQTTATGLGVDLASVASACGIADTETITEMDAIAGLRERVHACGGTSVSVLKIDAGEKPRSLPVRDGVAIKQRFRRAVLGAEAEA